MAAAKAMNPWTRLSGAISARDAGRLEDARRLCLEARKVDPDFAEACILLADIAGRRDDWPQARRWLQTAAALSPSSPSIYEFLAQLRPSVEDAAELSRVVGRRLAFGMSAPFALVRADALAVLGQFGKATALLRDAIALPDARPQAWLKLADILRNTGRAAEAQAVYRDVLDRPWQDPDSLFLMAEIAEILQMPEAALARWEAVITLRPDWADARFNAAKTLFFLGRHEEAITRFRHLIADPTTGEAIIAPALNGLAGAYRQSGAHAKAVVALRWAVCASPSDPMLLGNLSEVCRLLALGGDAVNAARRAAVIAPAETGILNNLALALAEEDQPATALAVLRRASAVAPQEASTLVHMLDPLSSLAEHVRSKVIGLRLLALAPDRAQCRYAVSIAMQAAGELGLAWRENEYRFEAPPSVMPQLYPQPRWDGRRLPTGTKLLVWAEQGIGDEVAFAGMLPDLIEQGFDLAVECDRRLAPILSRSFPTIEVIGRKRGSRDLAPRLFAPDIAAQVAMGSLAKWTRPTLERFYRRDRFLVPDPTRLEVWKRRLAAYDGQFKVGMCWRSSRRDGVARRAHTVISDWDPLFDVPGIVFVNLQYQIDDDEVRYLRRRLGDRFLEFPDLDLYDDFEEVLALASSQDLVISTVTTNGCFPAAAGTPTWLLLREGDPFALRTGHHPWFPTTRGFLKRAGEDWSRPMHEVRSAIKRLVQAH